ncbi:MAG: mechanosensitive ion channel family protein [Nostocaceae cyanobacterium]|nr:mechanosensitive ion channel family protein [Nostocaceae cyanobacterium]
MSALIQKIQTSLLELVGSGIKALPGILVAIVVLLLTRYIANKLKRIIAKVLGKMIRSHSLRSLFTNAAYIMIWVVGILAAGVIAFPSLRLGDILGLLGLGSVAIGLVFQDLCKNFIAGVILLLQDQFKLQDQVLVGNFEGTIEEIDFLNTQILTYQGERVLLPNSMLLTQPVKILTASTYRRTDLTIGVDCDTPLATAIEKIQAVLTDVEGVFIEPAPIIDVALFGSSSIDLVMRYWTLPQQANRLRTQTRVLMAIKELCDREGIILPYPIRTSYLYDQQKFNGSIPREIPS